MSYILFPSQRWGGEYHCLSSLCLTPRSTAHYTVDAEMDVLSQQTASLHLYEFQTDFMSCFYLSATHTMEVIFGQLKTDNIFVFL